MRIRCPHCRNPIEVLGDDPLSKVNCPSCGSTFSLIGDTATEPYAGKTPKRIAHFELLEQVGMGAFGSVWKARDTILDRIVALKFPRVSQLSPEDVDFFFRGARAAAQLRHPGIVSVHEVGRDGDTVFIATNYIDGANLKEWLSVGGLLVREAVELLIKVADAVHHAHEQGIVHRDLKPENILLDIHGEPHVADFGLAKRETGEVSVTAEGQLIGTAQYMSPEQAAGRGHYADARSDVYSLGVILFELLTGELPFRGEKRMLLVQIVHEEPPRPRRFNARAPRDLETVCLKCLEKDPHRRYATAKELADDLRRYLKHEPIQARPVGRLNRAWRWTKRNPTAAALLATLLLAAIAAPIVAIQQAQLRQVADEALGEQIKATGAAERAESRRADQLWRSLLNQARANRTSGRPGRRFKSLEALKEGLAIVRERRVPESEYSLDFRNEAIAALALSDIDITQRWRSHPISSSDQPHQFDSVNVDAAHNRYLRSDAKGNITVRRISDDQEIWRLAGHDLPVVASVFSPDGRFLAVRYGLIRPDDPSEFKVWDLETGKTHMTAPFTVRYAAFNFSRDGRRLAVGTLDPIGPNQESTESKDGATVVVYDLDHPQRPAYHLEAELPEQISFDHSGRKVAFTNDTANVVDIYELEPEVKRQRLPHPAITRGVDWSPDGSQLAVGCYWDVLVWDLETRQHNVYRGHLNTVTHVAFNRRGDQVASRSWDYTIRLWDIAARRELLAVPGGSEWAPISFGQDDRVLSFAREGSEIMLYHVAAGRELRALITQVTEEFESNADSPFRAMDFSYNDRWLLVADEGYSRLWDITASKEIALLPMPLPLVGYQQPVGAAFSRNDSELINAADASIQKWPIKFDQSSGELHIGPPTTVSEQVRNVFSMSDRHILGLSKSSYDDIVLVDRRSNSVSVTVSHTTPTTAVFAADEKWLATAGWKQPDVKVWDASTGDLLHTLPAANPACISLSPDGQLLLIGTPDEYRGIETNSWQSQFVIPRERAGGAAGHSVFSDDGKLVAVRNTFSTLQLIDPYKGVPIAVLHTPHEERIGYFCFNHQGDRLAVRYVNTKAVEIWDLRLIRQELQELGLDWDLPEYPLVPDYNLKRITQVKVDAPTDRTD